MLTVGPERGASWTEEASRAACAHQTAPTSPGKDLSAAPMERPTKTNAHCWKLNAKVTPIWTYSTRANARVSKCNCHHISESRASPKESVAFLYFLHFVSFSHNSPNVFVSPETCRDVLCPGSSTCVVDQTNNAYCVTCNRICPEVTSPEQYLCGNDGIIYASACHLRRATCLLGRSIGVAYEGKCISKSAATRMKAWDFTPREREREREVQQSPTLKTVWVHFLSGQLCSNSLLIFANIPVRRGS